MLVVSYQRNFYPAYACARELVQKGVLGQIKGIVAYVTQNWGGKGWRMVPELSGGGMFMDTGSHLVAAVLWITGLTPVKVSAFMDKRGKQVDMDAVINARFRGGALGSLSFVGSASRHDERLAIHGDAGTLVFHFAPVAGAGGVAERGAVGGAQAGAGRYAGRSLFALDSQRR